MSWNQFRNVHICHIYTGIPCVNSSSQGPPLEGIWLIRCPHSLMPLILLRRDNGATMIPTGFCPPHNGPLRSPQK